MAISITVEKMIKDLGLEVVVEAKEKIPITTIDINRPGLQLDGYYKHFAYERVQVMGMVETSFFNSLSDELKYERADRLLSYAIPCLIVTRGLDIRPEIINAAQKYGRYLLRTTEESTKFINRLINYLNEELAPRITLHGVLVDVYGLGILILGESGIGKSETALELVKRGHRLVADDAVEIRKVGENTLVGSAPELIRHFIEIRGIGILDVKNLYGVGAIRNSKEIDMIVQLEEWQEGKYYDRLGLEDEYMEIMGINRPKLTIPVRPGRNLAIIMEVAAMNHRQKTMGYNAAQELNRRLLQQIDSGEEG
ncbi:Hpr(Ser) kinase/phosphatase [Caldanaerobius fijiensis DSM 17918]|uniref:HPr kinase/phosphorylase n=1 Tax=Caldanaerobius fijiensis DSM 17918 TaxID=1121256 RepID=A0A1M5B1W9_9THEO|nr:Hpr(Ser) kinase/phosphatase [Caldanaerobius fijiensis DSM 17918]